jgi:DNA-directed RNA polymerase subunit RPC12/RpoP
MIVTDAMLSYLKQIQKLCTDNCESCKDCPFFAYTSTIAEEDMCVLKKDYPCDWNFSRIKCNIERITEYENTAEWTPNAVGVYRCSNCHSNMIPKKGRMPKYCDECGFKMLNGGLKC